MTTSATSIDGAIQALRQDLLGAEGAKISTMRNYRFAILLYEPEKEFILRGRIRQLSDELEGKGWNVLSISLHKLLVDRLQAEDPEVLASMMQREERLYEKSPDRALNYLKEKIAPYIEGPEGIAKDIVDWVDRFIAEHPDEADRTLIFLGRAGALYPFFRSSALLKHLDGKTRHLPVVLLYPGSRKPLNALSFMTVLSTDRDYRPRVYS
jgi:Domain of unknown function (DUF1788)